MSPLTAAAAQVDDGCVPTAARDTAGDTAPRLRHEQPHAARDTVSNDPSVTAVSASTAAPLESSTASAAAAPLPPGNNGRVAESTVCFLLYNVALCVCDAVCVIPFLCGAVCLALFVLRGNLTMLLVYLCAHDDD